MTLPSAWLRDIATDLKIVLAFSTRFPFLRSPVEAQDFARAIWAIPLAGVVVGLVGALVYAVAHWFAVPPLAAAALVIAATFMMTGGLHEDGLADTADGMGGGATRERKLEIMRDHQIGTFGSAALILSFVLRTAAIASLAPAAATAALVAAHAASRATLPVFMWTVPRARGDGLSAAAGDVAAMSALIAAILGLIILVLGLGVTGGVCAALLLIVVMIALAWLALHHIGGQTGDILGALQQTGEIAVLLVAAAG
jgi:adenosylcobinamide-GDP ribazoletransferase